MDHKVFISYSRQDKEIADSICKAMEDANISYWIDRGEIASGEAFHEIIVRAIKQSEVTVFISSANSNISEYAIKEIVIAFKNKKHIIPFCIDEVPYADKLEFYLCDLDQLQYYLLKEFAVQKLLDDIKRIITLTQPGPKIEDIITPSAISDKPKESADENHANAYEFGKQALLSYQIGTAFEELFAPALANYKDSRTLVASIVRLDTRMFKVERSIFDEVKVEADKGNDFAQYIMSRFYTALENNPKLAFEYASKSAQQGSEFGLIQIGKHYDLGVGVERDERRAVDYYKRAVSAGNVAAMLQLGKNYLYGWTVVKNLTLGLNLIQRACDNGDAMAINELSIIYWSGEFVDTDKERAKELALQALEMGYVEAYNTLGNISLYKEATYSEIDDVNQAYAYFSKGAELSEPNCMSSIAIMYYCGYGFKKDGNASIKWHKKAAEAGLRDAFSVLGLIYYYGDEDFGIGSDDELAWKWSEAGAKLLSWNSYYILGAMCLEGRAPQGVSKSAAIEYLSKAAFGGGSSSDDACIKLYEMFTEGEITPKDEQKAIEYLKKAADNNYTDALYKYGAILIDSTSEYHNELEAFRYLKKAADKESSDAMVLLADMFKNGIGVPVNETEAIKYLEQAVETDKNPKACYELGKHLRSQLKTGYYFGVNALDPEKIKQTWRVYGLLTTAKKNDIEGAASELSQMKPDMDAIRVDKGEQGECSLAYTLRGNDVDSIITSNLEQIEKSCTTIWAAFENAKEATSALESSSIYGNKKSDISPMSQRDIMPYCSMSNLIKLKDNVVAIWRHLAAITPQELEKCTFYSDLDILDIAEKATDEQLQLLLISFVELKIEIEGYELTVERLLTSK